MNTKNRKKLFPVISSILITLAIYTGTLLIFLYASGWRVDLTNQSLKKTGILTIESTPTSATIFIDNQEIGRTNKSTALDVGTYDIVVSKDGYFDWHKEVAIIEERSTPVFPWLIRTELQSEVIFNSTKTLEKYWADETNNHLLLLLKDTLGYQIVHYDINTEFWELAANPTVILTLENSDTEIFQDIDLQLSHTGELAILDIVSNLSSSKYILHISKTSDYQTLKQSPLVLDNLIDYEITWSFDDRYLMLESVNDVISYDINKNTETLLLQKHNPLDIWTTDEEGFFYILNLITTDEDDVTSYSLSQDKLDGSSHKELIPSVYFQNNLDYIQNFRATGFDFGFFTNSPQCTQTIGEVTTFKVNQKAKGLYIETTQSTYWYDMTTGKYITVSPYPATLIGFSPDNDNLLFKNSSKYEIFTFDKEEGDHTVSIGTKEIKNILFDQVKDIDWISNSNYISFEEDNFIYIADKDGDNGTPLVSSDGVLYWNITNSRENLVTLTNDLETGVTITIYTIH